MTTAAEFMEETAKQVLVKEYNKELQAFSQKINNTGVYDLKLKSNEPMENNTLYVELKNNAIKYYVLNGNKTVTGEIERHKLEKLNPPPKNPIDPEWLQQAVNSNEFKEVIQSTSSVNKHTRPSLLETMTREINPIMALLKNPPELIQSELNTSKLTGLINGIEMDVSLMDTSTLAEVKEKLDSAVQLVNNIYQEKKTHFNALSNSNFLWEGPGTGYNNIKDYNILKENQEKSKADLTALEMKNGALTPAEKKDLKMLKENKSKLDKLDDKYGNRIEFFNLVHNRDLAEGLKNGKPLPEDKTLCLNCYNMVYLSAYLAGEMDYNTFKKTYSSTDPRSPGNYNVSQPSFLKAQNKVMSLMFSKENQKKANDITKTDDFFNSLEANEVISWDNNAHIAIALGNGKIASFWTSNSIVGNGPYLGRELGVMHYKDLKVPFTEVLQTGLPTWRPKQPENSLLQSENKPNQIQVNQNESFDMEIPIQAANPQKQEIEDIEPMELQIQHISIQNDKIQNSSINKDNKAEDQYETDLQTQHSVP